jgi:hypothetical protein
VESSRKEKNGETKKQLEEINSDRSWKKLKSAELFYRQIGKIRSL